MSEQNEKQETRFKLGTNIKIAIFVSFLALIVIVSSIIAIIFARGDRPTTSGLVETGTIRISSVPEDINAFINNEKVNINEKLIQNLEPGEYNLRITREDYSPWEKQIIVEAGLVEEVNVKLFPKDLNLQQFTQTNIDKAKFSSDGNFVYYVVKDTNIGENIGIWRERITEVGGISIFNNSDKIKLANIESEYRDAIDTGDYELVPSENNEKLLIKTGIEDLREEYILSANSFNNNEDIVKLSELVSYDYEKVNWLNNAESLVLETDTFLSEFNLNSNEARVIDYSVEEPIIYTISNGLVYIYDDVERDIDIYERGIIRDLELENVTIFGEITELITNRNQVDTLVYLNTEGDYYLLKPSKSFQTQLPDGFKVNQISRDGQSLILETNTTDKIAEFSVFNVRERLALNRFETTISGIDLPNVKPGTDNQVTAAIDNLRFTPNSSNIIIETEARNLFITDREGGNPVQVIEQTTDLSETNAVNYVNGTYTINNTGTNFYILVSPRDDNEAETTNSLEEAVRNIYFVPLIRK